MLEEKELTVRDFQKEYKNEKAFIINLDCVVIGVWRNLRKLCTDMKIIDTDFPSYWTLTRKRNEAPIKFATKKGEYSLSIEKLK